MQSLFVIFCQKIFAPHFIDKAQMQLYNQHYNNNKNKTKTAKIQEAKEQLTGFECTKNMLEYYSPRQTLDPAIYATTPMKQNVIGGRPRFVNSHVANTTDWPSSSASEENLPALSPRIGECYIVGRQSRSSLGTHGEDQQVVGEMITSTVTSPREVKPRSSSPPPAKNMTPTTSHQEGTPLSIHPCPRTHDETSTITSTVPRRRL